jgi:hypothetical protein
LEGGDYMREPLTPMALRSNRGSADGASLLVPFVFCSLLAGLVLVAWRGDELVYLLGGVQLLYALLAWVRLRGRFDVEQADSLYFLGFLLTVSLLAVAFLRATSGGGTLEATLVVVGQGLILTVLGLFLRQAAVLGSPAEASSGGSSQDQPQASAPTMTPPSASAIAPPPTVETIRAAIEVREAAERLRAAAERITAAQDAIGDVVTSLRESSAHLHTEIAEAARHITGGAHDAAAAIVQAASEVKLQLDNEVAGFRTGTTAAVNELSNQSQSILEATQNHGRLAAEMLTQLQRAAESATTAANNAMTATEAGSKALAERARNLPDVGQPARQYADSLANATTAIESAHQVVVATANAVAGSLTTVRRSLENVASEAEQVVDEEKRTLERVRKHYELFRQLENEYVTLVKDLHARARSEADR